jgi:hypothetical protein
MDLSFLTKETVLGLQLIISICALFYFFSSLCHNIFAFIILNIFNMQFYNFIIMAIACLLALSSAIWLACIRGRSTVCASRVAQDGLICLLMFMIMGFSGAALGVNR